MLGKGAGRGFPGHPMLNPSKGTFSMCFPDCRPGGGASERGNGSDRFQGWDGGNRLEEKDALRPVPGGFLPACQGWIRSAAGSRVRPVRIVRSRRAFRFSPRAGVPGGAFGWGKDDPASQGGAPPGAPLRPHAATFPVSASTGTKARVSQE
jgi:hypothetical protein